MWLAYGPSATLLCALVYRYLFIAKSAWHANRWLSSWQLRLIPTMFSQEAPSFSLQGSAFHAGVMARLEEPHAMKQRRPVAKCVSRKPRIGCLGRFAGALSFGTDFFLGFPKDAELIVFDLPFEGRALERLAELPLKYIQVSDSANWADAAGHPPLSEAIEAENLDVLVNIWRKAPSQLFDSISVPMIAHVSGGSDILHHPRIDLNIIAQLAPHTHIKKGRIHCRLTDKAFGQRTEYLGMIYDARDIVASEQRKWRDRQPFLFAFGSLFKFSPRWLDSVLTVLADDQNVDLVIMGRDSNGALDRIRRHIATWNLQGRFHFEGGFSSTRDKNGDIPDPNWQRCKDLLSKTRVSPDSWPNTGGSSRFEAYLLGAPFPYMQIPKDVGVGGRRSYAEFALPILDIPETEAFTPEEFTSLIRRCLYDECFADLVATKQTETTRAAGDAKRWWREFMQLLELGR
ncbi:MAG: hypothetical protein HQL44_05195 [Alphaproteobacteria bacterium]|nr:hypothetical protein [Alphaproteobacteria bacterium]